MRPTRYLPRVEALEARDVPAVTATLDAANNLHVRGTEASDAITVRQVGDSIIVSESSQWFDAFEVQSIKIDALGGDDTVEVRSVVRPVAITEGAGANRIAVVPLPGSNLPVSVNHMHSSGPGQYSLLSDRRLVMLNLTDPDPVGTVGRSIRSFAIMETDR